MDIGDEVRFSGFSNKHEFLNGVFRETKERNHGRPVYKQVKGTSGDQYLYYWDEREGPENQGWWLAPEVGCDTVWALARSKAEHPPVNGWRWPPESAPSNELRCCGVFRMNVPAFSSDLETVEKFLRQAEKILNAIKESSLFKGKRQPPREIKTKLDEIRAELGTIEENLHKSRKLQHDRQKDLDSLLAEQRKDNRHLAEQKKAGMTDKRTEEAIQKKSDEISKFQSRLGETQRKIKGIQVAKEALSLQIDKRVPEAWKASWTEFTESTEALVKEYERWIENLKGWRDAPGFLDTHRRSYEALQKKIEGSTFPTVRRGVAEILYLATLKQLEKEDKLFPRPKTAVRTEKEEKPRSREDADREEKGRTRSRSRERGERSERGDRGERSERGDREREREREVERRAERRSRERGRTPRR